MTRTLSAIFALLLLFATLIGCTDSNGLPTPGEPTEQPVQTPAPVASPLPDETPSPVESVHKVGVSMPDISYQRWNDDGHLMKDLLEANGYEVDLQFGDNDVHKQIAQIQSMVDGGCEVLVIAAVEGEALTEVLIEAKNKGVTVIAYVRLIMDANAVDYYITFDYFGVGVLQGEYIRDVLNLDSSEGSFNIEMFSGDPGDSNILIFYNGTMSVLDPYLDSGKLVIPSGQRDLMLVATLNWSPENARERMANLISSQGYTPHDNNLHAVTCVADIIAPGVTAALLDAGFVPGPDFPIITGQDCELVSIRNIIAGTQSMSVFKYPRILVVQAVAMVEAILKGEAVPVNDTTTYYDFKGESIPSFLCMPVIVDINNYREFIIDSGLYTEDEIFDNN